jgi:multisubunit Na+/H+ antiporter MnhB subunit
MDSNPWISAGIGLLGTVVLGTLVYHFFPNAVGNFFENAVNGILAQFP